MVCKEAGTSFHPQDPIAKLSSTSLCLSIHSPGPELKTWSTAFYCQDLIKEEKPGWLLFENSSSLYQSLVQKLADFLLQYPFHLIIYLFSAAPHQHPSQGDTAQEEMTRTRTSLAWFGGHLSESPRSPISHLSPGDGILLQLVHPQAGAGAGWHDNQMVLGEAAALAFSNVVTVSL